MLSVESAEVMEEKSAETGEEWEPEDIKQFEAQWLTLSNINCLTFRDKSDSTNDFWGNRAFFIHISKPVNNSFFTAELNRRRTIATRSTVVKWNC